MHGERARLAWTAGALAGIFPPRSNLAVCAKTPARTPAVQERAASPRGRDRCRAVPTVEATERIVGRSIERVYVDKGYRGHDVDNPTRVFISGQKRGVFGAIARELKRRSGIEPTIGHMKGQGHLGRCYLKGREGDAANAVLCAAGYNFRLILAWLSALLRLLIETLLASFAPSPALKPAS